jgi:hypothetical protein
LGIGRLQCFARKHNFKSNRELTAPRHTHRAYALSGDPAKAKTAYQDFLGLWRDADPDVPILKEAKAEYAKLQYLKNPSSSVICLGITVVTRIYRQPWLVF